jgi:hypothetical protein
MRIEVVCNLSTALGHEHAIKARHFLSSHVLFSSFSSGGANKRREELDIKAFALQESTARLERAHFEFLKRRCESDEARVNVEKERLLQDRMK